MTNKLNWRLKDLPDAAGVAELVDTKVITPEEARELLFSDKPDETRKVKELEEEVKFLRELCDKLAAKSNGWTTIVREYHDYRPRYPQWYASYGNLVSAVSQNNMLSTTKSNLTMGIGGGQAQSLSMQSASDNKMLSKLNLN